MSESEERDSIETLKDRLYSRDRVPPPRPRRELRPETTIVPESWETIEEAERNMFPKSPPPTPVTRRQQKTRSLLSLLLAASFLFFSISAVVAGYLFFAGSNVVSADNIIIEVHGPLAVPGGEELSLQVSVTNKNAAPVQSATLIVDYPEGTRSADDLQRDQQRFREDLGVIRPGEKKNITVRAILYGEENAQKDLTLAVEYRIDGSNAIFFTDRSYSVVLSSAPVALTVESLKEVSSGQEVAFVVRAVSNATSLLRNVRLVVEYPPGFTFTSGQPAPSYGTTVWSIGDLRPGDQREVAIRGILSGQNGERRIFRFETGVAQEGSPSLLASMFVRTEAPIDIRRPFLQMGLALNGARGDAPLVIAENKAVAVSVDLANTLSDPLRDVEVIAKLSGSAYNPRAVVTRSGFFRSQNNTVVWNRETEKMLETLQTGGRAQVDFAFTPLPFDANNLRAGEVVIEVSAKARRIGENNVPEIIESTVTRKVAIGSTLTLKTIPLYSIGPFANTGPIPPRVEQRTTYTLMFSLSNTANEVRDVILRTRVPWYVEWLGIVSPQEADVSYNEISGDLVWRAGTIPAGAGYGRSTVDLAVQVAIEPSFGQLGSPPILLYEQTVEGIDMFTGTMVQTSGQNVSTRLMEDPQYMKGGGSGAVVE